MTISRRSALSGLISTGIAANAVACGRPAADKNLKESRGELNHTPSHNGAFNPPLAYQQPTAMTGLLLNQERAMAEMQKAGVDLLISATAKNIYYLTNQRPVYFSLGLPGLSFATLSAHGDGKPTLLDSQIGYYFTAPEELSLIHI